MVDRSLIRYRAGLPTEVTSVFKNGLLLHEKIDLAPMHRMPYVRLMSDEERREFNEIDASMQLAIPLSPKKAMFIPVETPSKETKIGPAESFTFSDPHFIDGRRAITFSALGKDGFVIEETDIIYRNGLPFQIIQKVKGGKKVDPTPTALPTP